MIRDKMPTRERLDFSWFPDSTTIPGAHFRQRFASTAAGASINSGELRIISGTVNTFSGGARYALRGGQIPDNFEVYARIKLVSSGAGTTWFPSLTFRTTIADTALKPNRAYLVNFGVNGYNFGRTNTGVDAVAGGGGSGTFSSPVATGGVLHLRFRVQGDLMLMRGWKSGEVEPNSWPARVVDTAIPRKGEIGILLQGGSATNAVLGFQDIIVRELTPPDTTAPTDRNLPFAYGATATLPASIGGNVVRANATSAPFTLTLPPAASVAHEPITVKKIAADATTNVVTLAAAGSDTIDGATTYALNTVKGVVTLLSYGTGYDVI